MPPRDANDDRPCLLVTNDDGIDAPGLAALGCGRSAHLGTRGRRRPRPRAQRGGARADARPAAAGALAGQDRFEVDGTPTDCVHLGVFNLTGGRPPQLVLSGINRGANLGDDVTYSGTVAAALEGTLLRIPSIAFSVERDAEGAARTTRSAAAARRAHRREGARERHPARRAAQRQRPAGHAARDPDHAAGDAHLPRGARSSASILPDGPTSGSRGADTTPVAGARRRSRRDARRLRLDHAAPRRHDPRPVARDPRGVGADAPSERGDSAARAWCAISTARGIADRRVLDALGDDPAGAVRGGGACARRRTATRRSRSARSRRSRSPSSSRGCAS